MLLTEVQMVLSRWLAAEVTTPKAAGPTAAAELPWEVLDQNRLTELGGLHAIGIDAAAVGVGSIALFLLVVARMAGLIRQVEQQAAQLETLTQHDPRTGAANRRAWDHALPVEMDRARRAGTPLAVALLDLDRFKGFNDQYGHQAGDQLLRTATEAWRSLLRSSDLLARYGGEEFAVLMPSSTLGQAVEIVDRLRLVTPLAQTFSAGVALWHGAETSDQLVARADKALYRAKQAGRNQVLAAEPAPVGGEIVQNAAQMARLAAADRPST